MRDFFSSTKFKVLVAVLCLLLGFMIAAVYSEGSSSPFADVVNTITAPLQSLSSSISDSVSNFFQKYTDAGSLHEENEELRRTVNELRTQVADHDALLHENEQYRQIIGEMKDRTDLTIRTTASVIGRDGASRFYSFTIDKGSLDGVHYMDPVIHADGLVGYVSEVGRTSSKVRTLLDIAFDVASVNSLDSNTREIGIVSGTIELAQDGLCLMKYLPRDSEIQPGDSIYTSGGGGGLFPKNIYIGEVTEVRKDNDGTGMAAVIQPGADVSTVKNVFVITDFEGKLPVEETK